MLPSFQGGGPVREEDRLQSVHCLRFVAASGVVLHHITTGFGSHVMVGAAGVDVFFVISGIVIGLALASGEAALAFATKRFIRVMPLYWLATGAYALFRFWAWGMEPGLGDSVRSLLLWPRFGTEWVPIYFPAWTLTYEMLFYCCASLCLLLFRNVALLGCFAVFSVVAVARIPVPGSTSGAFFSTGVCLEFCAGLLLALLLRRGYRLPQSWGAVAIAIAAALFWVFQDAVLLITEKPNGFHLARPLELGIASTLLLAGALSFERAAIFRSWLARIGGDASYAIYLTHVIAIDFISNELGRHGIRASDHAFLMTPLLFIACLVTGACTHLAIERPLLSALRRALLPARTIASASASRLVA
jgi:exopolysaccharide production protein ExoZ